MDSAKTSTETWQIAVQKHLDSLSPAQKAAFKAPASAADCISIIQGSERRRGLSRVIQAIQPILEPLERFENVLDVVVQTNGAMGSPIWGPLKFAIQVGVSMIRLACDHVRTLEKLAIILQRIVDSLARYTNYESLFKNHIETQRAIGALYCDLIDLCTRVVRFHSRPSISAVFVSFDKEFQQVSNNISHHATQIDWAANAANIEEAKKAREAEEKARNANNLADVQKWLSPAMVHEDLHRLNEDLVAGSCQWAIGTPEAQAFLNSETSAILRIGGDPGSGKSTLAAFFIEQILLSHADDVLYFFCKGTDEGKNQPYQALRTLVAQLLARDTSLDGYFTNMYQKSGQEKASSFTDLREALKYALKNTSRSIVYIVVDALDECEEAEKLSSTLIACTKTERTVVKLILTCREEPDLLDTFVLPFEEIVISANDVRDPVWEYVRARVDGCSTISGTPLGNEVYNVVASAADGLWLYARLMMDEIERLPSAAAIRRQLQDLPTGLVQLYEQIFSTMEKSFTPLQLNLCRQVFLWIEMSTFVRVGKKSLTRGTLDLIFQHDNYGEEVFDSIELARQLCSPIVGFYTDARGKIELDFVHHSAAQYVHRCAEDPNLRTPKILMPQRLKELYRGNTAAWFFGSCSKAILLLESMRENTVNTGDYFEMAYALWNSLCLRDLPELSDENEIAEATRLCNNLTDFITSEKCLVWIEMAMIINYIGRWVPILYRNVEQGLEAAESSMRSSFEPFREFSRARKTLMMDYTYVIYKTSNAIEHMGDSTRGMPVPEGFFERPTARKMLELGEHWREKSYGMRRVSAPRRRPRTRATRGSLDGSTWGPPDD
ncbi:Vegetative incompatibility HET-E-1 protein [Rutstroemia sp. NJR-2017a WRK4]|nr:Vegetative incompatibility HET-E-1 protein [Rutstroemia sp. NJR-2017a WRK4]